MLMVTVNHRNRGFSIGEILLAFSLLSVISILLMGAVPATILGLDAASQRANAALIAQDQLEQLRRLGFGAVISSTPPYTETVIEKTTFTTRVEVQQAMMSNGTPMELDAAKAVRVVVSWTDRKGPKELSSCAVVFKKI